MIRSVPKVTNATDCGKRHIARPARGLLLVCPITTAETLGGGMILLTENTRQLWTGNQGEVVAVGELAICEDDDCEREHWINGTSLRKLHPCALEPGDWVLVEPRQFVELEDKQWLAPQDSVIARITSSAGVPSTS